MGSVKWLAKGDVKILYADYSNMNDSDEIIKLFKLVNKTVFKSENGLLVLSDFNNCVVNSELTKFIKNSESKAASKLMIKSAVIGIEGIKKALLNFYNGFTNANAKAFDDKNKAILWLLE